MADPSTLGRHVGPHVAATCGQHVAVPGNMWSPHYYHLRPQFQHGLNLSRVSKKTSEKVFLVRN